MSHSHCSCAHILQEGTAHSLAENMRLMLFRVKLHCCIFSDTTQAVWRHFMVFFWNVARAYIHNVMSSERVKFQFWNAETHYRTNKCIDTIQSHVHRFSRLCEVTYSASQIVSLSMSLSLFGQICEGKTSKSESINQSRCIFVYIVRAAYRSCKSWLSP